MRFGISDRDIIAERGLEGRAWFQSRGGCSVLVLE